jgi:hypothetical protein
MRVAPADKLASDTHRSAEAIQWQHHPKGLP